MSSASRPSSDPSHDARLPSLSATHPINGTDSPKSEETTILEPGRTRLSHGKNGLIDKKAHEAATRAAKAEIRAKLREDWQWPKTDGSPPSQSLPYEDGLDWRERESDEDSCLSSSCESHDSISPSAIPPWSSRKRKRHDLFQEEMSWNDGVRCFVERRDAWTCARHQTLPTFNNPFTYNPSPSSASSAEQPLVTTLLPIAPPILPSSNIIRRSITAATYPSLYSKIVVRGLTPTVPVNLKDMTVAMVEGWKRDGEWPPRPEREMQMVGDGLAAGGTGTRRLARRSVGRVKKALGFGNGDAGEEQAIGVVERV